MAKVAHTPGDSTYATRAEMEEAVTAARNEALALVQAAVTGLQHMFLGSLEPASSYGLPGPSPARRGLHLVASDGQLRILEAARSCSP